MSRIQLASETGEDFDRILEHLHRYEVTDAPSRIEEILQGISALQHNPLIGRPARADLSELIIGRQSHGYAALYLYVPEIDTVFVLAIRNQREAGYKRP